MREQKFKLTPAGRCRVPTCGATVYAELIDPARHKGLCAECEEKGVGQSFAPARKVRDARRGLL